MIWFFRRHITFINKRSIFASVSYTLIVRWLFKKHTIGVSSWQHTCWHLIFLILDLIHPRCCWSIIPILFIWNMIFLCGTLSSISHRRTSSSILLFNRLHGTVSPWLTNFGNNIVFNMNQLAFIYSIVGNLSLHLRPHFQKSGLKIIIQLNN